MKSVSVHIVTYNSSSDIVNCLNHVKDQTYKVKDIIIIDNCSSDETVSFIQSWMQEHKEVSIRLMENEKNVGFAGGHNQAISQTNTDFVLVLNPDVCLDPTYLEKILNELHSDPEIGSATGKLYRDREKNILDSTGISMRKNRRAYDRGANQVDDGQWDEHSDIFGVSGAAAVYRRTMINQISLNNQFFDELFFAYKEDVDVAWRARLLGWKAKFVHYAIADHSRGWKEEKKRKDVPLFIRKHSYINRYYSILKNDRFGYFFMHLPSILLYEIPALGYALLRERQILGAWKEFYVNLPIMIKKRKLIFSKKKASNRVVYQFFRGNW